jgi:hypothetical protein
MFAITLMKYYDSILNEGFQQHPSFFSDFLGFCPYSLITKPDFFLPLLDWLSFARISVLDVKEYSLSNY